MGALDFLMNFWVWGGVTALFFVLNFFLVILFVLLVKRTHLLVELKAWMSGTPIGIFFQDNKFAEWKPITAINGIVYDEHYGPFIVTTTYVDRKTKNIIMAFDVDMDGDRSSNLKELVTHFRHITTNEKSIVHLRASISAEQVEGDQHIKNVTSHIKFSALKSLFINSAPHCIKSKIEKIVSQKLNSQGNVDPMQAIIVFGAIFGIIVMAAMILKTTGGV